MNKYAVPEIKKNIFWVGARDWNRRIFDALIPLPQGTTYNSYLVKGDNKNALIDTVNPGFEKELVDKINEVINLADLDFIIMNHAERDHAGSILYLMELSKAMLITTEKGAKAAQLYYGIPDERIRKIKDGDTIELGGKTLKFIETPWLHWPETTFTYLVEDRVLFPCDFLGAHTAFALYDDEAEEIISLAKRYFGEIMMPFRNMGEKALEKIRGLDLEIIAPSHGPVYRNPGRILEAYQMWTRGETKKKVIIVYVSMWGSTQTMAKTIAETLLVRGIDVAVYDLASADIGDIARDLVDSRAIVLGIPTVLGGMHPLGIYAAHLVKILRPPLKYAVILSSFGWGGGAIKQALEILGPTKVELVDSLEINGPPSAQDLQKIVEIGNQLSNKIKE